MTVLPYLLSAAPEEKDVVAGWTAFGIFGLLALAVVVLGFSLTKRLKNVEKANAAGLYDPSDPKAPDGRPLRGLALARYQREQAAAESAHDDLP
jgi:hypothetical protein